MFQDMKNLLVKGKTYTENRIVRRRIFYSENTVHGLMQKTQLKPLQYRWGAIIQMKQKSCWKKKDQNINMEKVAYRMAYWAPGSRGCAG